MDRYICIHCHFYQPPRENPWLEAVELQDSAYPYHDWNERITAECYAPNAASRILDGQGRITQIINNYGKISFNFGPTLLSWMEQAAPDTYQRILQADKDSQKRFGGHGSAIAQVYNHMILPLSSRRDKQTQVIWGIRDFERRFGRFPEGMWLAETAVDTETLEVLAEQGIKFTILAPHQAKAVRKKRGRNWLNVEGGNVDPTRAYVCHLPSGRSISLFFYDGPISRAVAFEKLLSSGENFASRLVGGFSDARKWPQMMHIATDGETYGHHHPHGDMALAYALHHIESQNLAKITNYGEYLEKHPPEVEAQIVENTSWSCAHGVERWRSDCGCNSGMKPGWRQHWREPLRKALDWLRDELTELYEEKGRALLKDPWRARDVYVNVLLDRSPEGIDRFIAENAVRELLPDERTRALKLLEMQRHAMLMYTSCGWFFDELTGIETVQVIFYAGRALQLANDVFGQDFEPGFLDRLAHAKSNVPEYVDGANIYRKWIKPAILDLLAVGAHYAISSIFEDYAERSEIYCYDVTVLESHREQYGRSRLSVGRAEIRSQVTGDSAELAFGAVHLGDHNVTAGVRHFRGPDAFAGTKADLTDAFGRADIPGAVIAISKHFDGHTYSLKSLFRDEQRKVLDEIMRSVLADAEMAYRHLHELHGPLVRFLADIHMALPEVLRITGEFVINMQLREELAAPAVDVQRVRTLVEAAGSEHVMLDHAGLSYLLKKRLGDAADAVLQNPIDAAALDHLCDLVQAAKVLPFEVDLWKVQNAFNDLLQTTPDLTADADSAWATRFRELGELLNLALQVPRREEVAA